MPAAVPSCRHVSEGPSKSKSQQLLPANHAVLVLLLFLLTLPFQLFIGISLAVSQYMSPLLEVYYYT
jgi:hypothetical protein